MQLRRNSVADELVPLSQRVRYMQIFRLVTMVGVLFLTAYAPKTIDASLALIAVGVGAYLGISLATDAVWRFLGKRSLWLFGLQLMFDGVFLAWLTYTTGGIASPLRNLILLHLIAVTLLASYRTGLKLAMWHSLLVFAVYNLETSKVLLPSSDVFTGAEGLHRMVAFIGIFWLVALATASFSAVNERELRRRRYDLEALAKMSERLEGTSRSADVAEVLLDCLIEDFGFLRGVVLGANGFKLSLLATQGKDVPSTDARLFLGVDAIMHRAWETRQTQLVTDLFAEQNPCIRGLLPNPGNLLIVPLSAEGKSVGIIVLEHSVKEGSRIERRIVSTVERFCDQGALALRNANLVDELAAMAVTDGLTGISNRRHFEERLEQELSRASRQGTTVTLALLDIDHFKKLNDTYGHQTGDNVLRRVAKTLTATCRNFDIPARYGGEEFVLIMPGCDIGDAHASAERFRIAVKEMMSEVPVTVSVGVATFPQHASDGESLVKQADKALYESKANGRDQVRQCGEFASERAADQIAKFITGGELIQ